MKDGELIEEKIPSPKIERNKGKSLLSFPNEYVVVDIETTGLSPVYDSIIEISSIKYKDNKKIDIFSSLVQPDDFFELYENEEDFSYLPKFITSLTGITDDMLKEAPKTKDVLEQFIDFIGDNILIGHNVNFDINFLYDNINNLLEKELSNNFVDTMRLSRRINSDLDHHRLSDLAVLYSLDYSGAHRSLNDCELTQNCYINMRKQVVSIYGSENDFIEKINSKKYHSVHASDIQTNKDADRKSPVYGKVFVFTGKLEKMNRKDAMQLVANLGGELGDNVTKKTNYLVLGNNDYCTTIKDGKSSKQKKAEKLKQDGFDIEIIPEDVFYEMISGEY